MLKGKFIGVKEDVNSFVLENKFSVCNPSAVMLRATALGLYYAKINGLRVGDCYLTPGWTSYDKMLQVQEYDVTRLLKEGENDISFTIGEGWYKGPLSWMGRKNVYGKKIAICADIIIDGRILSTDVNWTAKTSCIVNNGIYDGEETDLIAVPLVLTPQEVLFDKSKLIRQICEPVRTTERLTVKGTIKTESGTIYDFGQNISGVVEIVTPNDFNGTLIMRHSELLIDEDIYTGNLGNAKATDRLTCKGRVVYAPEFTFHGFRYMKLMGADLPSENITALVRHTDMKRTGKIITSNERINRLISNIVWGQRDNFVDIPSDCPQRSERLGWTGDINAFLTTAAFNYDIRNFMKKWLHDCRNDQYTNGEMPHIVPNITEIMPENVPESTTAAMWSDCIVSIPYKLYCIYGDKSFLSDNYQAIKKFISAREKYIRKGIIASGYEYGDWLAMDGEVLNGTRDCGRTDKYFIANVLYFNTLKEAAEIAKILGEKDDAEYYKKHGSELLTNIRREYFTQNGRLAVETVTAQALALHFGIAPKKHRAILAEILNENVVKYRYRMVTGFIGTPYLLFALADNGYIDTACRLLINNGYPGWLYEIDMGATTVWERWNTLLPDGKPNSDGMNSCNHYAYGSVMEFIYRRICGIDPMEAGFKKVKIAPNPCKQIPSIRAEYDSVNGRIVAGYRQNDDRIEFYADIPEGVTAEIYLPGEGKVAEGNGSFSYERKWENLDVPIFNVDMLFSDVYSNPKAIKAFEKAFEGVFHPAELAYLKSSSETMKFAMEYLEKRNKLTQEEFLHKLFLMNELFLQ